MHDADVVRAKQYARLAKRLPRRLVSIVLALDHHGAVQQASAMAFWLFLGLVPLAAIFGWAITKFAGADIRDSIISSIVTVAPEPALNLVDEHLHRLVGSTEAVAPLSLIGFLWVASGGVHTAFVAIQTAQAGYTRSWLRNRSLSLAFVVVSLLLVTAITTVLVLATPTFWDIVRRGYVETKWIRAFRYGAPPMSTLVATLGSAAIFRLASMRTDPLVRKRIWPGAIVTGLSWVMVSWLFTFYVRSIGRYPILYGSLAAVALLMLWLWISSFLLLLGSEVNLQLEGTRKTIVPTSNPWLDQLRKPISALHVSTGRRLKRKLVKAEPTSDSPEEGT